MHGIIHGFAGFRIVPVAYSPWSATAVPESVRFVVSDCLEHLGGRHPPAIKERRGGIKPPRHEVETFRWNVSFS